MRRFGFTALAVALLVLVVGWFTGLRVVFHGAMLGVATIAFLPFLFIASLVLLFMAMAVAIALAGADGGDVPGGDAAGEAAFGFVGPYYRFLGRQRRPEFWGVPVGVLLGGLLCWAALGAIVVPGEARTVEALAAASQTLDSAYETSREFPAPVEGALVVDGKPIEDGFGRSFIYETKSVGPAHSWSLRSRGYNGVDGGSDDLCVDGGNAVARLADAADALANLITRLSGDSSVSDTINAVHSSRCR